MEFSTLEEMVVASAASVRPPERLSISEAAEKFRYLNNPGSFVGKWSNNKTPYLIEPQDTLQSLDFTAMVFAGPARTGKSDMFFNWLAHTAICDPADMMMVHMTQNSARDWSQGDLRKVFRHSTEIGDRLTPGKQNLNVHDVRFMSGMRLLVKWPTISELSGKTIPRLWLNDYDRMPESIEGEGTPFDLTRKRAQTFKRFGMCVAESSPGYDVEDTRWLSSSPHEAPPTRGILSLYNRGDRRRWHWRCPQCKSSFEPDFSLLDFPNSADPMEASEQVSLVCPHDGFPMSPDMQYELNLGGRWVKDGMFWQPDGTMVGTPRRSDIASFWMKGPAAAFTTWGNLVFKYVQAMQEYESTGSEQALRGTVTLDQGNAYVPKASEAARLPETLKARAEDWGGSKDEPVVPDGVRFLIATIDVQKTAFVVQVQGFGAAGDMWIVDMFKIRKSARLDRDGHPEVLDPAAYPEDWHLLVEQVIEKTYPLSDKSGRRMSIKSSGCDSGGRDGVTSNAYAFWRWLRNEHPMGYHKRFQLVKGEASKTAPRVRVTYPDSSQKGVNAIARGDIPVLLMNSNAMKDQVSAMLGRDDPGTERVGGMIHFPIWADDWLYTQLTTEIRTAKGWENKSGRRNEAMDLTYYGLGLAIYVPFNWERLNWESPPGWAAEWDVNDMVFAETTNPRFTNPQKSEYDLTALGESLA